MERFCVVLLLGVLLSGCLVPVDTVINIKGKVVDEGGDLYDICEYVIVDDGVSIFSFESSGEFEQSAVLGGFSYKKSNLVISCDGGEERQLRLPEPPQSISEYIDFGVVIVERVNQR